MLSISFVPRLLSCLLRLLGCCQLLIELPKRRRRVGVDELCQRPHLLGGTRQLTLRIFSTLLGFLTCLVAPTLCLLQSALCCSLGRLSDAELLGESHICRMQLC